MFKEREVGHIDRMNTSSPATASMPVPEPTPPAPPSPAVPSTPSPTHNDDPGTPGSDATNPGEVPGGKKDEDAPGNWVVDPTSDPVEPNEPA